MSSDNNEAMRRKNAKLPKVLGKKIQNRRNKLELSQEDVAFKVGISRVYMGYIEQGRNVPSLEVLQKICKALDIDVGDLI
jgi:transcriptional regulator with XRE-family HTH domain